MSEEAESQSQGKPRASSRVCSLTSGWQRWASDNRRKQEEAQAGAEAGALHRHTPDQEEGPEGEGPEVEDSRMSMEEEEAESEVTIRRPSALTYKKEAEDANRINALSDKYSAVGGLKSRWQSWAAQHSDSQKLNPFSEYFDRAYSMSLRLHKGQDGYGRPKEGSKTAERAKRAEQHIHREIQDMCYVIRTMADPDSDGRTRVTFGELFDRYVRISDKVVGILMRARKHGKVDFQGEMLWQGRDDGVIITLLV